ncbi:MAG TPA: RHS repeat-associated core domain-containing protein [Thermoanaerobaculia bacterium]|nr:RHS repeat-associated core domain-containing protein [Thermoanaerobaculia bacterium]
MQRPLRGWKGLAKLGTLAPAAGAAVLLLLSPGRPAAAQPPAPNPLFAGAVWVGDAQGILKLLAANGDLLFEVSGLEHVRAVAVDDHRYTVWVATHENLLAYGFDGRRQLAVPFEAPGDGTRTLLAVNTADGSLWMARGKTLLGFSAGGQTLHALSLRADVVGLSLDPAAALLWVATSNQVRAYDALAGSAVRTLALGADADVRDLSADPATSSVWVARQDGLLHFAAGGALLLAVALELPLRVSAGPNADVWAATRQELVHFGGAGQRLGTLRPFAEAGDNGDPGVEGDISHLVTDPSDGSVWAANRHELAHATLAGRLLRLLDFDPPARIHGLAVYADVIPPQLDFALPAPGSFVGTSVPALQVDYSDIGSGVDAGSLAFEVAGSALAVACVESATGATCTPTAPIPDGTATVTATVKDFAGNVSHPAAVTFTVDTIPPAVAITSPASGLLTNQPQQTVAGSVSKPATVTVDGIPAAVAANLSFAQPITLLEGPNAILVVATDAAGNRGQASVQVTLDTVPPAAVDPHRVTVTAPAGGASTVSAGPGSAEPAATVLLTDTGTGATSSAVVAADGSFTAAIACQAGDTIQIVLRDAAGNSSAPATVTVPGAAGGGLPPDPSTVATPVDRTVVTDIAAATAFLYTGANAIQQGVQAGTVQPFQVAVVRGSVHDRSGQPIAGVGVKILGHPELGGSLTRADGFFDLAVNGGGQLIVQFDKAGYFSGQRAVSAPWRDYAWLPDVVLVAPDGAATRVDTTRSTLQVIRGTPVQDGDGTRQATLLFRAGTSAQLVLPGGQASPLPTLTVRATEYSVGATGPQAMPAALPPSSAYTYAVELGADEAAGSGGTVQFSQPVPFYLENFLGFPVGGIVPAGYYNPANAAWVASDNGLVVQILSVTAGLADLDVTGAGAAANPAALAALGITADEQQSLAALYPVGQTLWRVPVRHFSTWDFNWPYEVPPGVLEPPNPDGGPPPDLADSCQQSGGSVIDCENQTLGEDVPIVGTPFRLHYQSDRAPGRIDPRSVQVLLSGPNPPPGLVQIDLTVAVAGRLFQQTFAPGASLSSTFTWDGIDGYGRLLQGEQLATVTVTYLIDGQYAPPPNIPLAFGQAAIDANASLSPTRYQRAFASSFSQRVGAMDASAERLGGWTLDVHHDYDFSTRTVWRGDGSRENADPIGTAAIDQFALIPTVLPVIGGWLGADGSFDLVDQGFVGAGDIYQVDRNGNVALEYSNVLENVPIWGVARDKFNQLFFASCDAHRQETQIRTVLLPGSLTSAVVLATPGCGTFLDFLPDNAGGFYLVDGDVYHLGPDGTLTTVVDASTIPLFGAQGAALAGDGTLFVADTSGGRIFRRDPSGLLTVVAGTGTRGSAGDGGPAILAQLQGPTGILVAPDGTLWVNDGVLRRIDRAGFISTVPGVPLTGRPFLDPNGLLYVLSGGPVVSRIGDPFPGASTSAFLVAAEDASEVYQFSAGGQHLSTVDPVTGAVLYSFIYDGSDLLTGVQDRDGRITQIQRDPQGNAVAVVSPDGQTTTLATGPDGYLQAVSDPAAAAVSFTYAAGGLMATRTDPRGYTSTYQYSAGGRLVADADAAGGLMTFSEAVASPAAYSVTMTTAAGDNSQVAVQYPTAGGRQRLFTGPDGLTVRSAIAPNGQQTVTWPDGSVVTTSLGADPRFGLQSPIVTAEQTQLPSGLTMATSGSRTALLNVPGDPLSLSTLTESWALNGNTYRRLFDRSQMTWTFQTPAGRQFIETVNAAGHPTSLQAGTLAATQLAYDAAGRLISATQGTGPEQRTLALTYGADGRVASTTDALQRRFTFGWDAAGRLTSQSYPDGRMVVFTYDANGNLTSVTPPGRPAHQFAFTPVNLAMSYTPPDLGGGATATTYGYDPDRRLTSISRPDGKTVSFGYQQGRLSSVNFERGTISLTYDPTTSLLQAVSAPGGEALAYLSDGPLPISISWSGPVAASLQNTFNQDFRLSSQTVNGQLPVAFLYDADGLMTWAGGLSVGRDPSTGSVTSTSMGSVSTATAQNRFGELSSFSATYAGSQLFAADLTRDAGGRITQRVETISGTTSTFGYSYDAAGRLTDVSLNGTPLSHYDYDANSNRVSTLDGSTTTTASYDAQDRLLQWGDLTFAYNANGDLSSMTQNASMVSYVYDSLGNLVSFVDANGIESDYVVDGQNRRVGKLVAGVLVQGFVWLDKLKVAAELDGSGNVVSRFIYATHVNAPDAMVKAGISYVILTDQLGSPRMVVDSTTGDIAQRLDYDAWGRVTLDTNPGFQPFGFAGGLYDQSTALVRFGARDYDAAVGRWTARDPVLFRGGDTNLYGYAVGDPVNLTDPSGLDTFVCTIKLHGGRDPNLDGQCRFGLCHEYLCVIDENDNVTCGGQGASDNAGWWDKLFNTVPGANDSRAFNRKHCPLVNSNQCVDKCVTGLLSDPSSSRPAYNDFSWNGGRNCQAWAEDVLFTCKSRCSAN